MLQKQRVGKLNLKSSAVVIAVLAVLIAADAVLGMLEIHTGLIRISLTFIPMAIAARLYGVAGGALVSGLGDILGCLMHPVGAWYPPITLTYVLVGAIFGLILRDGRSFPRVLISVGITQLIVALFINTLWISLLSYNSQDTMFIEFYFTKVAIRVWQVIIMIVIELITIPPILKAMESIRFFRKLLPGAAVKKEETAVSAENEGA